MKHLFLSILLLVSVLGYTGSTSTSKMEHIARVAPEMVIKEEDLTFSSHKDALEGLNIFFNECYKQEREDFDIYDSETGKVTLKVGWEQLNIGMPNCLLKAEGYGLISQREIIRLKLENARLKGEPKVKIIELEQDLVVVEEQIKVFLSTNIWVD